MTNSETTIKCLQPGCRERVPISSKTGFCALHAPVDDFIDLVESSVRCEYFLNGKKCTLPSEITCHVGECAPATNYCSYHYRQTHLPPDAGDEVDRVFLAQEDTVTLHYCVHCGQHHSVKAGEWFCPLDTNRPPS